jgi:hypothetical protein
MEFTKLEAEVVRILHQAGTEAARMNSSKPSMEETKQLPPRLFSGADQPKASAAPQVL